MAGRVALTAALWLLCCASGLLDAPKPACAGRSRGRIGGSSLTHGEPDSRRGLLQQPAGQSGPPSPTPDNQQGQQPGQQAAGQAALLVHVQVSVVTVVTGRISLRVGLERRPPGAGAWGSEGWINWASSHDREITISPATFLSPQTLAVVSERMETGDPPTEGNPLSTVAFTELFENLPDGEYRARILDLDRCTNEAGCAVIAYSTTHIIADSSQFGQNIVKLGITYGALELGLRFTKCANGTDCYFPAAGVQVALSTADANGANFPAVSTGKTEVDRNGYAVLGAYLGLMHTIRLNTGLFDGDLVRPDVVVEPQTDFSLLGFVNLGVLDVTKKDIMCSPTELGIPAQQLVTGGLQGMLPSSSQAVYTPGLQCYWQIIPDQPVQSITISLLNSGTGLGAGSELKIFSILPSSEIQLAHTVSGFTQKPIIVSGSQFLLFFSSQSYSPMGTGFRIAWAAEEGDDPTDSWFDSRTATILFSSLAGVAYLTAALAAVKWWRQRSQQRAEEANRQALRDAQRATRRRNRADVRRRRHRGLPVELVSRLPTSTIQLADFERDGEEEPACSICLCEYEDGEKVTWLPCSHNYHTTCVAAWLKNSLICPICKDNVKRSLLKTLSMYRELHRSNAPEGTQLRSFSTGQSRNRAAVELSRSESRQESGAAQTLSSDAQLSGEESEADNPHASPSIGIDGQESGAPVDGSAVHAQSQGNADNRV